MKNGEIDWTFDNLSFLVLINPFLQVSLGVASLLISVALFYVVIKSTPEELIARRANVITQLVGCILQSVMYSIILQPIPLYPHRAVIFTGPFRHIGSFACTILFVLWTSSITFTANAAVFSSVSHYLGTMEGMRQKNSLLEWYAKRSFKTKSIIVTCSHIVVAAWSAISLFLSTDFNTVSSDTQLTFLPGNYALLHMHSRGISLAILGISFTLFTVFYIFQLLYLNWGVWLQLNEIKSSISPTTWEILHHTSLLFLSIAVQPMFSFIIPTAMFILFNFAVTSLESAILLNLTVWTTIILYTTSPFLFHLLTLISFKIYRHQFLAILRPPLNVIFSRRQRRISVFPQHEQEQSNKYAT